jgi:sulfatase maturation enzyme AslB (radical SAM superfamily)
MKSCLLKTTDVSTWKDSLPKGVRAFLRKHKAIAARLRSLRRYKGDPGKPNILHIAVTDKCNMRCPNCLYRNDNKNFRVISAGKAESLIREIDAPIVLLSGGEPLLDGAILETTRNIAGISRQLGRITGILTNGVTLKKVVMSNFPEFRPSSAFFFQISVDGLKDVHNSLRGNFDQILENIRFAKEAGNLIYTNTVVSNHNVHELDDTMRFISGFSDRMYLNPILTSDSGKLDMTVLKQLGDYIVSRQDMMLGNSVIFGKFLKGQINLKCMFHSLVSVTPSGRIKFPCYCYEEGSEYLESFQEFLLKVNERRGYFENKADPQCKNCYTHCLHEAHTYANFYWHEIFEQVKRPLSAYKKYIRPLYHFFS